MSDTKANDRTGDQGDIHEVAIFAAGCFWGVEETFRTLSGIASTEVGYTGGNLENPSYKQVCQGDTGHTEAVRIEFDPRSISYQKLLEIFWESHDPTTPNRQGPDIGYQYRSAIFYTNPRQKAAAEASKNALEQSRRFGRPIVTAIEPAATFFRAEEYHQQYLLKRGTGACH